MDIDLGCSAAVLRRRLLKKRPSPADSIPPDRSGGSETAGGEEEDADDDGAEAAAERRDDTSSFTVSCSLTRVSTSNSKTSNSSSTISSSSRSANNRSAGSSRWRRRISCTSTSTGSPVVLVENRHQLQVQHPQLHEPRPLHQPPQSRPPPEGARRGAGLAEDDRPAPDWTERLLLVLRPPDEEAGRQRRQPRNQQFEAQLVRQIFCVLFRLDLLAKLLANLPSLKAIVSKARCCLKLRDALLFRRLPRTGCMVKYMMFSFEGNAKCNVDACLRFLEAFDPAFAGRRPWRSRGSGCPALVLRWNRQVPENTLLSMYGQRLMTSSRFFCCSPVGPNTGWARADMYATVDEEGAVPEGLLG